MPLYFWQKNVYDNCSSAGELQTFWTWSLYLHIFSWIAQFVGHGVYEGRSPALLDNLLLTLVAPDFIVIEVMFWLGWEKDAHERCKNRVAQNIAEWKNSKAAKAK
jgi:uncharacterized membrane protein YGL010W